MYKKSQKFGLIFLLIGIFLFTAFDADAQRRKKRRTRDKDKTEDVFKPNPIWWGINIGNLTLFNNQFNFGLAPMVGYKLSETFSLGAIADLNYYYVWNQGNNSSFVDYGIGAFGRAKFSQFIFAHLEYKKQNLDFGTQRQWLDYFYVGGGYSSSNGGPWAYELSLLYNVNSESNRLEFPFDYRIAFTYNF